MGPRSIDSGWGCCIIDWWARDAYTGPGGDVTLYISQCKSNGILNVYILCRLSCSNNDSVSIFLYLNISAIYF